MGVTRKKHLTTLQVQSEGNFGPTQAMSGDAEGLNPEIGYDS